MKQLDFKVFEEIFENYVDKFIKKAQGNETKILNFTNKRIHSYHVRDNILKIAKEEKLNVDLIFSGHIHGGLIRFGKICLLSPRRKFFPKYSYGKNTLNNTTIITTSGIGNATIPIRLFNRPEIVEVILGK